MPFFKLAERRSVELYHLQQAFPSVPVFPGAITEWPDWFIHDYSIVARVKRSVDDEKRWREKQNAVAKKKLNDD